VRLVVGVKRPDFHWRMIHAGRRQSIFRKRFMVDPVSLSLYAGRGLG
jgi:hypothetical protein